MFAPVTVRRDGFPNERHIILPQGAVASALKQPVSRDLLPTAIGHFPYAKGHLVRRPEGIPEYILIYCVEGRGWCRIDGKSLRLGSNQVVVIPRGMPHTYGTSKNRPWTIYWVHFKGVRAADYMEALYKGAPSARLTVGGLGEMINHFESLYDHLHHGCHPQGLMSLSTALAHFLGEINSHRQQLPSPRNDTRVGVQETIMFMQRNLTRSLSVGELARIAHLSVPHYTSLFKKMTGYPPVAFFIRMKMQEAARLLQGTDTSAGDIGRLVGIEDPYYFSRQFKKTMGQSPLHYRENSIPTRQRQELQRI